MKTHMIGNKAATNGALPARACGRPFTRKTPQSSSPPPSPPPGSAFRRVGQSPRHHESSDLPVPFPSIAFCPQMEPLGDRILVKPFEAEERTEGGILLPSSAVDTGRDACFGEVLSVGEDVELKLSKGDKVVFNMMSSAKVEVTDGEIVFVHDKNILATLS